MLPHRYNDQHTASLDYADRCIDEVALAAVRKALNLPNNTRIGYDEHYQCHCCNKTFIDDFDETDNQSN